MTTNKTYFVFMVLLVPFLMFAKCEDAYGVKVLKEKGMQKAAAVHATSDNSAIVIGSAADGEYMSSIQVLRVNSLGNVLWKKTIEKAADTEDTPRGIIPGPDRTFVAWGSTGYAGDATVQAVLVKMNEDGHVLWKKQFLLEDTNLSAMSATQDGGFLLAGTYRGDELDGYGIMKLDADGTVQWDQINYLNDVSPLIRTVTQTVDGGYVLGGTDYDFAAYDHKGILVKTDDVGVELWIKQYDTDGIADVINSIVATPDGGLVAAGDQGIDYFGTPDNPDIVRDALVMKLTADGELEWRNTYGGSPEDGANSISLTDDGGYVFAGMTRSYGFQNNDGWVVKLDSAGTMQWHNYYPGDAGVAETAGVQQLSDGTYLAVGSIANLLTNWDIFVLHMDANGNI